MTRARIAQLRGRRRAHTLLTVAVARRFPKVSPPSRGLRRTGVQAARAVGTWQVGLTDDLHRSGWTPVGGGALWSRASNFHSHARQILPYWGVGRVWGGGGGLEELVVLYYR
jgi:hypothetical protein